LGRKEKHAPQGDDRKRGSPKQTKGVAREKRAVWRGKRNRGKREESKPGLRYWGTKLFRQPKKEDARVRGSKKETTQGQGGGGRGRTSTPPGNSLPRRRQWSFRGRRTGKTLRKAKTKRRGTSGYVKIKRKGNGDEMGVTNHREEEGKKCRRIFGGLKGGTFLRTMENQTQGVKDKRKRVERSPAKEGGE